MHVPCPGDVEALPEGSQGGLPDLNAFRIRPTSYEPDAYGSSAASSRRVTFDGLPAPVADEELAARGAAPTLSPVSYSFCLLLPFSLTFVPLCHAFAC